MNTGLNYAPAAAASIAVPTARPAGFWRRFVATMVDGAVISITLFPLSLMFTVLGGLDAQDPRYWIATLGKGVVNMGLSFFYFGWFYKNKGATPGKLLMGLRVVDLETGMNLSYGRTFLRDIVGKTIIGYLTLSIGFILAGFRSDKRALHDLLASTQVIRRG
jgi:uncharacterized RDD family membrane protein YckC